MRKFCLTHNNWFEDFYGCHHCRLGLNHLYQQVYQLVPPVEQKFIDVLMDMPSKLEKQCQKPQ